MKGRPEAGQVQQLIRSLGVTVEYDEAANLAEMPVASSLSNLVQKAERGLHSRQQAQTLVTIEEPSQHRSVRKRYSHQNRQLAAYPILAFLRVLVSLVC